MKTFKQFCSENDEQKTVEKIQLFESQIYKSIPGSSNSYRADAGNTNTKTLKHSHVYAKLNGRGTELYSVNIDGSGHDASSGQGIPNSHAKFFRQQGYNIKPDNILEIVLLSDLDTDSDELIILTEENV